MAGIFSRLAQTSQLGTDLGLLVLRLWFGLVMAIGHGKGKVLNLGGFIENVGNMGFPVPALSGSFAAFGEFFGGLALAAGLLSRVAGLAIIGTMLGAAFIVHASDPFMKKEFALAYAFAALVIVIAGPGKYSLDAKLFGKK